MSQKPGMMLLLDKLAGVLVWEDSQDFVLQGLSPTTLPLQAENVDCLWWEQLPELVMVSMGFPEDWHIPVCTGLN